MRENDFSKIKKKKTFASMCIVMKTNRLFQSTFQSLEFENSMGLFLVIDENKSHYVYSKDFDRSMFDKTKKKTFVKVVNIVLVVKMC